MRMMILAIVLAGVSLVISFVVAYNKIGKKENKYAVRRPQNSDILLDDVCASDCFKLTNGYVKHEFKQM